MTQVAKQTFTKLRTLPLKILIPLSVGVFLLASYSLVFFIDKPVQFSYAGATCTFQPTIFPDLHKTPPGSAFDLQMNDTLRVGKIDILSLRACFTPMTAPQAGVAKVHFSPYGGWFAQKTFAITIDDAPKAAASAFNKPIPTGKPLGIALTATDTVYRYALKVDAKKVLCKAKNNAAECPIQTLKLEQGKSYTFALHREFDNKTIATVLSKQVVTLPATNVVKAAITNGQTIYERPTSFEFEFDKGVRGADIVLVKIDGETRTKIPATLTAKDKKATITLEKELDRKSNYELTIDKLDANDGSTLTQPYKAAFTVSGGPKIASANVGPTGAALTQTVVLAFDQPLSDTQDISKFVAVSGLPASVTRQGNQLLISYAGAAKCTDFTITIAKGLESKFGIAQTELQTFSSRTICHTIQTIGYSKEGRAINAYFFGSGSRTILFTGAIHGNEKSSKYIMDSWINDLEAKAKTIPADKQIVVVPLVNPDGFYKYGRYNANNVNLNRNWPTSNWITADDGAGGPSPLSEPETQALAAFTQRLAPIFVATYHSQGQLVNSNDVGNSIGVGQQYARLTGYRFISDAETVGVLGETVTGTYEDWLKERGTPAILMELNTNTGNHFLQNQSAMWMVIKS